MDDRAVLIVQEYITDHLYEPNIRWPKQEFELHAYSRWAANEILERLMAEAMKLPQHISGIEPMDPVELIDEFINELDYGYDESGSSRRQLIFLIARDEAKSIKSLFI